MTHAAESTHWYTRKGEPAYTVAAKDGFQRPTTLRDARKLNLVPSVTTIIRTAAAPGLERWKLDQMMHAALTLPRGATEPEAEWIKRVWTDSQETAKKASERGTAIHAAIQSVYEGIDASGSGYEAHVTGAIVAVEKWWWEFAPLEPKAEAAFASPLGFGGKVDLSGTTGNGVVLDFKTKEFDKDTDLKTWDEHAMQLAAYREGLGMPKARCAIVYVSVTNPGLSKLIEIPEEELARGWECFVYLLGFWKAKNRFNSAYDLPQPKAA